MRVRARKHNLVCLLVSSQARLSYKKLKATSLAFVKWVKGILRWLELGAIRLQAEQGQHETKVLENSIVKICELLAVGFGDAGGEIISENIRKEGDLNPMVPGKRTVSVQSPRCCLQLDVFILCGDYRAEQPLLPAAGLMHTAIHSMHLDTSFAASTFIHITQPSIPLPSWHTSLLRLSDQGYKHQENEGRETLTPGHPPRMDETMTYVPCFRVPCAWG